MRPGLQSWLTGAALASGVAAHAQPAHLVRDINTTVVNALPSDPKLPAAAGGRLFFSAMTFDGSEPWSSDGTEAGTVLLRDIFPGGSSSQPGRFVDFAGAVFFPAESGGHGRQIWRTDGTTAGTVRVTDRPWTTLGGTPWVSSGGRLFFVASTPETGLELWSTDGTDAGTALVKDIQPGPAQSFVFEMKDLGGRLIFGADDGVHGRELWTSDGTPAGTLLLADLNPAGNSFPGQLTPFAGRVCFVATTDATGAEPWCTDGTPAGTTLLKDVSPGPGYGIAGPFIAAGDRLFFSGRGSADDAELWTSDGTAAGTRAVADIAPGPTGSFPSELKAVGDSVFFTANDWTSGREMWRSDGTSAGTVRVADIVPGSVGSDPQLLTASGGRVYFTASRGDVGREPWVTDGTSAGTRLVADIASGPASSVGSGPIPSQYLVAFGGNAYLVADDGSGRELWRLDPQPATSLRPRGGWARSSVAFEGHTVGDRLVFTAQDDAGREPWSSDGSASGTFRLKDICTAPCADQGGPHHGAVIDDVLYFSASDQEHGRELWRTDGTEDGTRLFLELVPGTAGTSPRGTIAVDSRVFFTVAEPGVPELGGLWAVETTTAAATRVGPYEWSGGGSDPLGAALNGRLVTGAMSSPPFVPSIYRSDGTLAGTETLRRLVQSNLTGSFRVASGIAFFAASGENGRELWRTDGTIDGTRVARDICPGPCAGLPNDIPFAAVAGNLLFFAATDDTHGEEPWVSDGTFEGTRLLKDVRPGVGGSSPGPFETVGGVVYWAADDDTHGRELWRSDGTTAGTFLVKDIGPGVDWGLPAYQMGLLNVGDRLLFAGCQPATGCELWETDGSAAGTRLLQDLWPGPTGGYGHPLGLAGGFAYFVAGSPTTGYEPWALPLGPRASVRDAHVVEGDGTGAALRFDVRVDGPLERAGVVTYETRPGTATSGTDFTPASGAITFVPGGPVVQTVAVAVGGDLAHEGDETLSLQLTGGTVAVLDGRGDGVIEDDDGPRVEAEGGSALEGDAGSTPLTVSVRLRTKDAAPTALPFAVQWQTGSGTATAGQDFTAADGLVTFPAGTPDGGAAPVAAQVVGDLLDEPDEAFEVVFRPASTASGAPASAHAAITDDDGVASGPALELAHASRLRSTAAADGVHEWFVVHQPPRSSYEAVVEDVSGDLQPILLSRRDPSGPTPSQMSIALGTGQVQTLRWTAYEPPADGGMLRLESDACAPPCGADDRYSVRVYDTTIAVTRLLNAGTSRTFLILFNPTDRQVRGNVTCWNASGSAVGSWSVTLAARASAVQDSSIACAAGASATITHDAGYGGLVGKAVTADSATGLTFDTPLTLRPR